MDELWSIIKVENDKWYDIRTNRRGDNDYYSEVYLCEGYGFGRVLNKQEVSYREYISHTAAIRGHDALFTLFNKEQ